MLYFIDFDRVIFDTDAYNESLLGHQGAEDFRDELQVALQEGRDETLTGGDIRSEAWARVSDAIRKGTLAFTPGELTRFVYPDAIQAIRALENNGVVITYGEPDHQKAKVESALAGVPRLTVLYTGLMGKADYLEGWPGYYGAEAVFVDDRVIELISVSERFPNIRCIEMRRDGTVGDGRWSVIHSLSALR